MLKKSIISGLFWTLGLKLLSAIIQVGTIAALARLLLPEDFGTMGIILMIVGFSKIFSEFGLGAAIIQKENVDLNEQKTVMFISMLIASFLTIIFFLLSHTIAVYFNNLAITLPLKVISIVFIIDSMVVIQIAIAQKKLEFRFTAIVAFVSYLLGNSILTVILAYFGYGIWALVWGYIFSSLITLILFVIKFGFLLPYFQKHKSKDLISFGSFFTIGRIANYFANNGDYFIIGKVLGSQMLGFYTRAYQMMSAPANLLGGTLQRILFPAFSKIQGKPEEMKKYFLASNLILAYLSLSISTIVVYWGEGIVKILLGQGWEEVVFPLKVLAGGLVFKLGYKITTPVMNAIGLVRTRATIEIIYLILIISGTYIGSKWGINGASIGVLIAIFVNFVLANIFCMRQLKIGFLTFLKQFVFPFYLASILFLSFMLFSYSITALTLFIVVVSFTTMILFKSNFFDKEIIIIKKLTK